MKEIKSFKKVSGYKRGSKDLVPDGEGCKDSDEDRLTFQGDQECFSICRLEHLIMR